MSDSQIKDILKILEKIYKKKYQLHSPIFNGNEKKYLINCLKQKNISALGTYRNRLIDKIKFITKAKYVILTSSGTAAMHLILKALNVDEKDEILMPSLNYIASANSVLYCNSNPHFVEIENTTLGVDPTKLRNYLKKIVRRKNNLSYNKRSKKLIKGIIVLHTFGHPCKIDKIKKICDEYNLRLIEDSAEALGSLYKNIHVGTFGEAGILSFNGNKIVTTGAGGAVITNDKKIANKIEKLSKISKKKHPYKYDYDEVGYNYSMPNLNAAIGLAQIENLKKFLKSKRALAKKIKFNLKDNVNIKIFVEPKNCKSNYWLQIVMLNKASIKLRNSIVENLIKNGLQSRPLWTLLHKINYLKKFHHDNLSISLDIEKKLINIPSNINE